MLFVVLEGWGSCCLRVCGACGSAGAAAAAAAAAVSAAAEEVSMGVTAESGATGVLLPAMEWLEAERGMPDTETADTTVVVGDNVDRTLAMPESIEEAGAVPAAPDGPAEYACTHTNTLMKFYKRSNLGCM